MKQLNQAQFRSLLIATIAASDSAEQFSRTHGINPAVLSRVVNGKQDPTKKILTALGMEKAPTMYQTKGATK